MAAQPNKANRGTLPPVSAAVRQRLQAVFEHGQHCVEKDDHDYAHDLFTQCLIEDPANLIYLQHFLANLAQKYGHNKKGSRFAALKIRSARMLNKAGGKSDWPAVFTAICEALKSNPWDTGTLLDLADAYEQIGCDECQLYTLRWALDANPKDPTVNRRAALTLARMGQFDQAIACWRRVEQAKPGDEEASRAIHQLSVEKTIKKGGYNQDLLQATTTQSQELHQPGRGRIAHGQKDASGGAADSPSHRDRETQLRKTIDARPADLGNYVELAELLLAHDRLREAAETLTRALAASGGGDLSIRERLEDVHLRLAQQQVDVAQRRAEQEKSEEAVELARRMAAQANQAELEVFAARAARNPGNSLLQYELGLRYKRAGKFKEAIQALQAARDDTRHKALVQLNLGESFQHIRQFRLALSSYEASVQATEATEPETKKLALYRAGVLAAELNDRERAERYLTQLAAIDFGYRDVADRLDKLAALRDSV
jgi:tetratricopeptide (TPR) repeat protein